MSKSFFHSSGVQYPPQTARKPETILYQQAAYKTNGLDLQAVFQSPAGENLGLCLTPSKARRTFGLLLFAASLPGSSAKNDCRLDRRARRAIGTYTPDPCAAISVFNQASFGESITRHLVAIL